jgi:glycosyltransferase involved in cell wall biosynthesis
MPDLSIIVPTYRPRSIPGEGRPVLDRTVARLDAGLRANGLRGEILVIYHGHPDQHDGAVGWLRRSGGRSLRLLDCEAESLAAARNVGLAEASSDVCLFLNDDTWARQDLLVRHARFHSRNPELEAALLGAIVPSPDIETTPFMRWFNDLHFGDRGIENLDNVGGGSFLTANVSAKTAFLRAAGGFDEQFTFGSEDIDLGLRLEERGMRLAYDARAVAEHAHPIDLPTAINRLLAFGRERARLVARYPERLPRRPSLRHRAKAAALTALTTIGVRTPRLQRETWRFLCHEALREGCWSAIGGAGRMPDRPRASLLIGSQLARLAGRDVDARMPG